MGADLCLRPEPTILTPPTRRRRWLVVYGGYAAFDSSPPAIMNVVRPDRMIVAPHLGLLAAHQLTQHFVDQAFIEQGLQARRGLHCRILRCPLLLATDHPLDRRSFVTAHSTVSEQGEDQQRILAPQ